MKNLFVLPALAFGLLLGTQGINAAEITLNTTVENTITLQDKYIDIAVENLPTKSN